MQLEKINQVNDIKQLNKKELEELAEEIRRFLIEKISVTGGPSGVQSGRGGADHGAASVL